MQTVGKSQTQEEEDARPDEADLADKFIQKFPPWQTVGKEATACRHATPSCENFM